MTHDRAANLLTDFLHGRIVGREKEQIVAHVKECAECASVSETFRLLQAGVEPAGKLSDLPHPSTQEIATLGLAPDRLDALTRRRIEQHSAECESCSEEIDITRGAAGSGEAGSAAISRDADIGWKWPRALAFAASLAALLLAYPALRALRDMPGLETEVLRLGSENERLKGEAEALRQSGARSREDANRTWSGAVPLVVLSSPSRGAPSNKTICVGPGQPALLLAVMTRLPAPAPGEGEYRFEVRRGDGSTAWSMSMTAGDIGQSLRDSGVVTFMIPESSLPSARYTLSLQVKDTSSPILEVPFTVGRGGEPGC